MPRHGRFGRGGSNPCRVTCNPHDYGGRWMIKPKAKLLKPGTIRADLRHSEVRYRRLFEAARDGILILDPVTRKITDANPFILKFLGYTRKQLLQKELWEIGLIKDEAASREAFRELKKHGFIRYEDLPLE